MNPSQQVIGQSFIELQAVDSTNNYATALLHEGLAQHGTVVLAQRQTAGRGQRNKSWITGEGDNIAMSAVILPAGLTLSRMFNLSMAVAVGVHRFFNRHTPGDCFIKWPNDLYWNDRKAGGILIENGVSGDRWNHAVVGIGININQTSFEDLGTRAVSLRQVTGRTYDVPELARELCSDLEWAYRLLLQERNSITELYHQHLYKRGSPVRLKKGPRVFHTRVKGVTGSGQLVTGDGIEEFFDVGDVEWLDTGG